MKKFIKKTCFISLILVMSVSCKHDNNGTEYSTAQNVSGQWSFVLIPDKVYQDTALIKNHRGTDFEVYSSSSDEVYLQQSNDQILGSFGPLKVSGTVKGNQVSLKFYDHPDGEFVRERTIDEMIYLSDVALTLDSYGNMEGNGTYQPSKIYPDITKNTFKVKATRIGLTGKNGPVIKSAGQLMSLNNWENDMCKVLSTITSWVISGLTDGIIRPMSSNCWLYHDGGGYFIFGHEGPGSVLPVFTTTLYYPFEKSCCQCREYGFNISLGGQNLSYTVLKDLLLNHQPIANLASKLGFPGAAELEAALDDFYNQYGEFAISLFYNCNTGSISLYANTQNSKGSEAVNSDLMQTIANAFSPHASKVYLYSGNSINDSDYLRRSPAFVCNTSIVVVYLFGTNNAEYN